MSEITVDSLEDLSQLVSALPAEARIHIVAEDVIDDQGQVIGHSLIVPEEWAAEALALASDMSIVRKLALIAYLKDKRWRVEVGGVWTTIAGQPVRVATERGDARTTLHQTYSAIRDSLRSDGDGFNFADGIPRAVSNADMTAAIMAALAHVRACFNLELALRPQIDAGAISTREAIDAAAWPPND